MDVNEKINDLKNKRRRLIKINLIVISLCFIIMFLFIYIYSVIQKNIYGEVFLPDYVQEVMNFFNKLKK